MWASPQAASRLLAKLGRKSWAAARSWQPLLGSTASQQGGASARMEDACQGSEAAAACRANSEPTCPHTPGWTGCPCSSCSVQMQQLSRAAGLALMERFTCSLPSASSHLWDKAALSRNEEVREWRSMSLLRTARCSRLCPGALDKASAQGRWSS